MLTHIIGFLSRPSAESGRKLHARGITAALVSAFFLGMAPIFGKQAILLGVPPLAVVALRTSLATLLLFLLMVIFYRPYLYIYPAGLLGCFLAGLINGVGSLFYYSALGRIDASLGQLLYSLYPLFLALWVTLDHQPPGKLTLFRLFLVLPALFLIISPYQGQVDLLGVLEMLIASALYALHLPINQRVLYDMPAPTVTLYTLLAMSAVVIPPFLFMQAWQPAQDIQAWWPLLGLTLVTFLSRLTLFMGVKHLGGMQTAILGLSELLVTIVFAQLWLDERFTGQQWLGAILLMISLVMVIFENPPPHNRVSTGWLSWIRPSTIPTDLWQPDK